MAMPKLSALDLSPIPAGFTATDALRNTIDLAKHCDELGLTRYWLAEHHNAGALASSAPEIMIGQVAAATSTMRVGSGGMMLPNHSALKVAELFRVLSALFPGRIDLGLGRAPGTDPRTARALRRSNDATGDEFPGLLDALCTYLEEIPQARAPFSGTVAAIPMGVVSPEMWILGSTDFGGATAAKIGAGFAFAHHINPGDAVATMRAYRAGFQPSARRAEPYSILAVLAICAPTDAEAKRLASSAALSGVRFAQGIRDLPLPTVDEAMAYPYDELERSMLDAGRERGVIGSPDQVRKGLLSLAEETQADELMVVTAVHDHAARRRSYALMAEALGIMSRGRV